MRKLREFVENLFFIGVLMFILIIPSAIFVSIILDIIGIISYSIAMLIIEKLVCAELICLFFVLLTGLLGKFIKYMYY